ncbi:MAG: isoprenylcysteine carboxylmethyltransferase family protein [Bacteroidales bacterium]|nr:isoprenylcysteine carboxylmethyltransferase family protein [Bacteroidales bacterium]
MNNLIRYILGYILGISVFAVLIPLGMVELSKLDPLIQSGLSACLFVRILVSLPFFITGLGFMIWSNIYLFRVGKGGPADGFNIAISPRTKKLVVTGPYRYSRNPMVFGAFTVYFSIGLFLLSVLCVVILVVFIGFAVKYLRMTEEKRLLKDFGEQYREYKSNVPMIFPKIKK